MKLIFFFNKDESGSDSEGAESTSSSYSSLSDFVSEMVSTDVSPSNIICINIQYFNFNEKYYIVFINILRFP